MKRTLIFCNTDEEYGILENENNIFVIQKENLIFNSKDFYLGLFKDRNEYQDIEFIHEHELGGRDAHVFEWIEKIITVVCEKLNEGMTIPEASDEVEQNFEENNVEEILKPMKLFKIKLYDLCVCAGDGFYSDDDISYTEIETDNEQASYAVKVSGKSMEPDYPDKSVILVKETEALNNDDIGIFSVDNELMCKKFKNTNNKVTLEPINNAFPTIEIIEDTSFKIQGKVIAIYNE